MSSLNKGVLVMALLTAVQSFVFPTVIHPNSAVTSRNNQQLYSQPPSTSTFHVTIDMPPSGSEVQCQMDIDSALSVPTELVVVRYKIPFALNVEPVRGLAVVSQPGPGGELPGDVLRYSSQFTLGLPRGEGLANTFGSFAGSLSWQCSMFDVIGAKAWEQVIEALTSNTESRTDEVVLIFERPLNDVKPPELQ